MVGLRRAALVAVAILLAVGACTDDDSGDDGADPLTPAMLDELTANAKRSDAVTQLAGAFGDETAGAEQVGSLDEWIVDELMPLLRAEPVDAVAVHDAVNQVVPVLAAAADGVDEAATEIEVPSGKLADGDDLLRYVTDVARERAVAELQSDGVITRDLTPGEWSGALVDLVGGSDPFSETLIDAQRQAESLDGDDDWESSR